MGDAVRGPSDECVVLPVRAFDYLRVLSGLSESVARPVCFKSVSIVSLSREGPLGWSRPESGDLLDYSYKEGAIDPPSWS